MGKKRNREWIEKLINSWGHLLLKLYFTTCRHVEVNTRNIETAINNNRGIVLMFWHRFLLLPFFYLKNRDATILVGTHFDAKILSLVGAHLGYSQIKGSSHRKPLSTAVQLLKALENDKATILTTPDGPRGPEFKVKTGTLKIIQRANAVIIPIGAASTKYRVFNSWDRFYLPKVFSKNILVFGTPILLPEDKKSCDFKMLADEISENVSLTQRRAELELQKL